MAINEIGYVDSTGKVVYQDKSLPAPSWYSVGSDGIRSKNEATGYAIKDNAYRSTGGAVAQPQQPVQPQYNPLDQMEQLKQAQLKASMAGLDKQRTNSLSNLSAERAVIEPQYQKQKMAAATTAKQTARSFDEYMAQRGSSNSGIAGQGTLLNNLGYQGAKGALDQAEAGAISDNARRVTGVNNAYESDVVGAQAGIEAQGLQNYIDQMNADRTFQQSQDQYNQNLSLQQQQYGDSQAQQQWENQFKQQGYSDDQAYRMAQLAIDQQNASRAYSGSSRGSITQSSNQGKTNMDDAMIEIDNQLKSGTSPGNVAYSIEQQRENLKRQGINVDALIKAVWERSGIQLRPEVEDSWR